jgi:hypothetical protein
MSRPVKVRRNGGISPQRPKSKRTISEKIPETDIPTPTDESRRSDIRFGAYVFAAVILIVIGLILLGGVVG